MHNEIYFRYKFLDKIGEDYEGRETPYSVISLWYPHDVISHRMYRNRRNGRRTAAVETSQKVDELSLMIIEGHGWEKVDFSIF